MSQRDSFTKSQILYKSKMGTMGTVNLNTDKLSQFPRLGNNTVEGVRDIMLNTKRAATTKDKESDKKKEDEKKPLSGAEQYRRLQSLYNTRLK